MSKVLIATGGTGGHIFPALSIGKYLKNKGFDVVFTGRKNSMEEKIIKNNNFNIIFVKSFKVKGQKIRNKITSIIKIIPSLFQIFRILNKTKPDLVIGTGGFVSGPVVLGARLLGITTIICEQNAVMGLSNRILSFISNIIFISYKNTKKIPYLSLHKVKVVGNFIREEFTNIGSSMKEKKNKEKVLLIFGGSQGAQKINHFICNILNKLSSINNIKIIHITGEKNFNNIKQIYENIENVKFEIYPFSDEIYKLIEKSDLIISRAGATSVAEIYYSNKKAILIPYPYAADNHQWYNAIEFCKTGRGVTLKENRLTEEKLLKWIQFFLNNEKRFDGEKNIIGNFLKGYEIILSQLINKKGKCYV